jgi:hypothetical protein
MTVGMHRLSQYVRDALKAKDPQAITTGENSTENMIDVVDGILYQRTLRTENKAPLFATVYQDYIPRYGMRLSVTDASTRYEGSWSQDHFFIECASLFVEGAQVGRLRLRPRDMSLSFEKPEHRPMFAFLERVLGYYRQGEAKKFLVYGQLLRPLEFREPVVMLDYKHGARFPALASGVFRADDGDLGIFLVNASRQPQRYETELDPTRYGLNEGVVLIVDTIAPDGTRKPVHHRNRGVVSLQGSLPAREVRLFVVRSSG